MESFPYQPGQFVSAVATDPNGKQEQTCSSLPFGDGESCTAGPTEHLFTQKELDSESNNYYDKDKSKPTDSRI